MDSTSRQLALLKSNGTPKKTCRTCGVTKAAADFYVSPHRRDEMMNDCKPCYRAKVRIKARNRYRTKRGIPLDAPLHTRGSKQESRARYRKASCALELTPTKYGETVRRLREEQDDCCAICREPFGPEGNGRQQLDHDHKTMKIRGLLCARCNHGLGHFRENPEFMRSAIAYVLRHRSD